jgi:phage shock protein PspC (stress-responsive transcriptional regulator)
LKIIYIFAVSNVLSMQTEMKKVIETCVGNRNFSLDEDAYARLDEYLTHFRDRLTGTTAAQNSEIMVDLEDRIAELFTAETTGNRVVSLAIVEKIIAQLGMPDGSAEQSGDSSAREEQQTKKKIYRDTDNKSIAGVCSGLATYLDIDVVLIRVIMLIALIAWSAGFWIYIILWIAVPKAVTPAQKCEMHGEPVTAENMAKYTKSK